MKMKLWGLASAAAALLAGCSHGGQTKYHGEEFPPDEQVRDVHRITDAQAAAAARAEGTLRDEHFDGGTLNSLGQDKLDQMLQDEASAQPLVIYLDLPAGGQVAQARQSVIDYLKGRGLPESQVRLQDGPNPRSVGSAAEAISALQAVQNQGQPSAVPLQQPQPASPGAPTGASGSYPGR